MPSLWQWRMHTATPLPKRTVHAVLARCLDENHHADRKPWCWVARQDGSDQVIEIGLLDDALAARLMAGADAHARAPAPLRLPMAGPVEQVAATTWAQLAATAGRPPWTVEFISPTTFRRGDRFMPWPAPSSVFGSLRASWRTFGAPHVGDLTVDLKADPLIVTAVSGRSHSERVVLRTESHTGRTPVQITVTGFVGRVQYSVDGPIDHAAVAALLALAPFAGVGAHTTRGFGGTRLVAGG
jgi:CRISPR-associated endoribonuclease Cas6